MVHAAECSYLLTQFPQACDGQRTLERAPRTRCQHTVTTSAANIKTQSRIYSGNYHGAPEHWQQGLNAHTQRSLAQVAGGKKQCILPVAPNRQPYAATPCKEGVRYVQEVFSKGFLDQRILSHSSLQASLLAWPTRVHLARSPRKSSPSLLPIDTVHPTTDPTN